MPASRWREGVWLSAPAPVGARRCAGVDDQKALSRSSQRLVSMVIGAEEDRPKSTLSSPSALGPPQSCKPRVDAPQKAIMSQPSGDFASGWKAKSKADWTELKVYYFGNKNSRIILPAGARLGIIKKIVCSIFYGLLRMNTTKQKAAAYRLYLPMSHIVPAVSYSLIFDVAIK